jgi:hypothetical protein
MNQFVVIAYDGTDTDALQRRLSVREAHLVLARKMKTEGSLINGGAILNEEGQMIGSVLIVSFASRAEVEAWLAIDPYVTGNVWKKIEVKPFRLAPL